jgi:hypothetical protein
MAPRELRLSLSVTDFGKRDADPPAYVSPSAATNGTPCGDRCGPGRSTAKASSSETVPKAESISANSTRASQEIQNLARYNDRPAWR